MYNRCMQQLESLGHAQGAATAQTLAKLMTAGRAPRAGAAQMLEPFWLLLADLHERTGDAERAAKARREALKGKLRGGRPVGVQRGGTVVPKPRTGAATGAEGAACDAGSLALCVYVVNLGGGVWCVKGTISVFTGAVCTHSFPHCVHCAGLDRAVIS